MYKLQLFTLTTHECLTIDVERKIVLGRVPGGEADGTLNIDLSNSMAFQLGVARRHLMLLWENRKFMAFDLGSHNGTRLNGQPMLPRIGYQLHNADDIQLGNLALRLYFHADVSDFQLYRQSIAVRYPYIEHYPS